MKVDLESLAGWSRVSVRHGFLHTSGPYYWRREEGGLTNMCFRVAPHVSNPMGNCHGGMLATFSDFALALAIRERLDEEIFLPTIGLSCEYLRSAPLGSLVISRPEVLRIGRGVAVARCLLVNEKEEILLSATGSFSRAAMKSADDKKLVGVEWPSFGEG